MLSLRAERPPWAEPPLPKISKEFTGPIDKLDKVMDNIIVDGNWVRGVSKDGRYFGSIKVFRDAGTGLALGRVSKMSIRDRESEVILYNYDRGHDVDVLEHHPAAQEFFHLILEGVSSSAIT